MRRFGWMLVLLAPLLVPAFGGTSSGAGTDPPLADDVEAVIDPPGPQGIGDVTVTVTGRCDPSTALAGVAIRQLASTSDMIIYEDVAVDEVPVDPGDGTFQAAIPMADAFPNRYEVAAACGGVPPRASYTTTTFTIANDPNLSMTVEPVTGHLGEPLSVSASGNLCLGEEVRIGAVDAATGLFGPPSDTTVTPDDAGNWTAAFTIDSQADDSGTYAVYARCHKQSSVDAAFYYDSATFTVGADVPPPAPPQTIPPDYTG